MKINKIMLDMDGVIVNFVDSALKYHDLDNPYDYESNRGPKGWEIEKLISMNKDEFWGPFREDFWATLPWTKEGESILTLLESSFGRKNITILSAPSLNYECISGKLKWLEKNMPDYFYERKYVFTHQKHLLAKEHVLLVDDSDKNVDNFREHGGNAVLVSRPWNTMHKYEPLLLNNLALQIGLFK